MYRHILREIIETKAGKGRRPTFCLKTYGCQMNSRDSEKMAALLLQMGYEKTDSDEAADLVLFNTCCVRESAEDRVLGHISRLKPMKSKASKIIAVSGCMTQQESVANMFREKYPYVDIVFGTGNRHRLPEFLCKVMESGKQIIDISEDEGLPEIPDVEVTNRDFAHKAGVNIMYGCDNFCAYCIVPYVRGREKSRPMDEILSEIQELAAAGVKEVMLLGQNVNSFQAENSVHPFADLLRKVSEIPEILRIRFMTSHPKDFSNELILAIKDLPKVCKSVHLPLQAGSTRVLSDMNRKYTKEDYLNLTARLKALIPDIAISTDIIVGYPGETDEDFEDTLDVVRKVGFASAFTFIYSKRSGTPAAERTDVVSKEVSAKRFERLTETLYPLMLKFNQEKIGKTYGVMIEETNDNMAKGRTDDHSLVHISINKNVNPGDVLCVKITDAKTFYLIAVTV